ncbi:MAG TPA: putative photosynthetic complex assembly protein PuhE [Pseudomonadales bacterium]|nr:putative photosynthetic complex assembly protein PuhE [Pseudomonadales bacterium]
MSLFAVPVMYALFIWWFSTGLILYLDRRSPSSLNRSMIGATAVLAAAIYGLYASRNDTTLAGAYVGFTCALLAWAWIEMSYFMGWITGPRKEGCPPGITGWRRFKLAIQVSLHHELVIVGFGTCIASGLWDMPNQVGTWTFFVLWFMRWSAKLNLFLGAPNLHSEFLPEHLRFLETYMSKKPINFLFPVSVTCATVVVLLLLVAAGAPDASVFETTGLVLVATLLGLAILEHWFLVVPLPDASLWRWAVRTTSNQPREGRA